MSNGQNSPPRLPDELIAEIFRNATLSCRDLFHCSLVSRKFVETVNKCLYEYIVVGLDPHPTKQSDTDRSRIAYDYTVSSWKLLTTLLGHQRLAKYVKEVEFDITRRRKPSEASSGLETTKPQSLSTFLRLGSNISGVFFEGDWGLGHAIVEVLKGNKNVTGLGVQRMDEEEEEFCAQHLPHLKRLSICELALGRSGRHDVNDARWKSLEYLDLWEGVKTVTEFPSFSGSFSTIRILGINIQLALDLDYSQLPVLHELALEHDASLEDRTSLFDSHSKVRKFWKSLSKSPSLRVLGFGDEEFTPHYEGALFPEPSFDGAAVPTEPIPTLRSLRFAWDFRVERAYSLLSGPLASTLQRVIVPSYLARPNASIASMNKLGAVRLWCETRGIELILADQPRFPWSILCTLLLPSQR